MRFIKPLLILHFFLFTFSLSAQEDESIFSKFSFEGDFRFRAEQDWDSKKSNGTFRDDRSRLRYRVRAGLKFQHNKAISAGIRIRTGNPIKQQDPQLTLGDNAKEFGTLPIGFEKVYFQGKWESWFFWLGKNQFPFEKNNEQFWSDNVYPEGVTFGKIFQLNPDSNHFIDLRGGHYIVSTFNKSFEDDAYFQGLQAYTTFFNNRLDVFPSIYLFKNIPNIPDGNNTFLLDYSIFHIGTRFKILKSKPLKLVFDYYRNLKDYSQNNFINNNFKDQKTGFVIGLKYGTLKQKKDWLFKATYTNLEQYAIVDFLAQNDWARWDYSSFDSPDGRLSNYNGIELVSGYKVDEKINLKMKFYTVKQLINYGIATETGTRIRFDIDYKF